MADQELRYSDCPTTSADLLISAPAAVIWPLVCDITLPARFSSEFDGGEWLDGATGPALGVRFAGRNHHPLVGSWQTTSTICDYEPGHVLGWAVGDPAQPSAIWRFLLNREADGTRLTQWMQIGPGPSGLTPAIESMPDKESRILHRRLGEHRTNMVATLSGIRDMAESGQ